MTQKGAQPLFQPGPGDGFVQQTEGTATRVAQTPESPSERQRAPAGTLDVLRGLLNDQGTVTDLYRLAASDDFKRNAGNLSATDLKTLRATYHERMQALDGKVKLEMFDGQVLHIVSVDWWHSDTFDNDGVTLHFRPESDLSKRYKGLTSSAPIVRFANMLKDVPTEHSPVRVLIALEPVRDADRAKQGQKRWTIKRLPMPNEQDTGGSPF